MKSSTCTCYQCDLLDLLDYLVYRSIQGVKKIMTSTIEIYKDNVLRRSVTANAQDGKSVEAYSRTLDKTWYVQEVDDESKAVITAQHGQYAIIETMNDYSLTSEWDKERALKDTHQGDWSRLEELSNELKKRGRLTEKERLQENEVVQWIINRTFSLSK